MQKIISEVGINMEVLADIKSMEELVVTAIFSHLEIEEQKNAYDELAKELGLKYNTEQYAA